MNKKNKTIFIIILFFTICVISSCIYFVSKNKNLKETESIIFRNEYMNNNDKGYVNVYLSEDNTVKYKTLKEIVDILNNGTGIIYLGCSTNNSSRNLVSILVDVANKLKKDIYYLDTDTYKIDSIFEILNKSLEDYNMLYIPTVIAVNKGHITNIYYEDDNKLEVDKLSDEETDNITNKLEKLIKDNEVEVCTKKSC